MRIGMMTLWNAANGPSIHAELIGRTWTSMGHNLTVFAPTRHPDARPTNQPDEPYVIRHYLVEKVHPYTRAAEFDPAPLLDRDYEVFVAENVERLPSEKLLEYYPRIREKAVTVMVVHEGKPPEDPLYYKFKWDGIICFDKRYVEFIKQYFPEERIKIIPYPCHPIRLGDKREARRELGLPQSPPIIFSYGFRPREVISALPHLRELAEKEPLIYLVAANPASRVELLEEASKQYPFLRLVVKPLPLDTLYKFFHASDIILINREPNKKYRAVISSSIHLALGALRPIIVRESNYVEMNNGEVIKYRNYEEMKEKILRVLREGFDPEPAKIYIEERRADKVALRFIELFEELLRKRLRGR